MSNELGETFPPLEKGGKRGFDGGFRMKRILSLMTLLTLLTALYQSSSAKPANLALLNDINIAASADHTEIEIKFDVKPGDEKILYRDDFVQIELPGTYTDPPKQWLKVEDEFVKNIFVYQFDANTVRVRLFTYGKAVNMRDRISIGKSDNSLMISYGQKPAVVNKKPPITAKVTAKNESKKNNPVPVEINLPETVEKVSLHGESYSIAGSEEAAQNVIENQDETPASQLPAESGTGLLKADSLPLKQDAEEEKTVLMKDPPGFTGSVIKMVTALGIVLSLLFAIVYLAKKYLGNRIGLTGQDQKIRVVTSTYLGPKKSIALVEVAGEKIVVGVTATHISMLTKVGREEDFGEVLKEQINPESTKERVELQDELWEKV